VFGYPFLDPAVLGDTYRIAVRPVRLIQGSISVQQMLLHRADATKYRLVWRAELAGKRAIVLGQFRPARLVWVRFRCDQAGRPGWDALVAIAQLQSPQTR